MNDLPNEVLEQICEELCHSDVARFAAVSSAIQPIAHQQLYNRWSLLISTLRPEECRMCRFEQHFVPRYKLIRGKVQALARLLRSHHILSEHGNKTQQDLKHGSKRLAPSQPRSLFCNLMYDRYSLQMIALFFCNTETCDHRHATIIYPKALRKTTAEVCNVISLRGVLERIDSSTTSQRSHDSMVSESFPLAYP